MGDVYGVGVATITNCYNTGSVSGTGNNIGGIVGHVDVGYAHEATTITNCYNTGSVSGSSNVGGIVGDIYDNGATITNCYYLSSVNASLNGVGHNGGTLDISSYYGAFGENQEVVIEDGSLPTELGSSYNLKDLLNSWVNINKEENPNLKNWQDDKENLNNGYPIFVKE